MVRSHFQHGDHHSSSSVSDGVQGNIQGASYTKSQVLQKNLSHSTHSRFNNAFIFFHRGHRKRRSRRSTRCTRGSPRSWRCSRTRTPSWSSRSTSSSPPSSPSSSRRGTSRSSRATTFESNGGGAERRRGRSSARMRGWGNEDEAEDRVGVGQAAAG